MLITFHGDFDRAYDWFNYYSSEQPSRGIVCFMLELPSSSWLIIIIVAKRSESNYLFCCCNLIFALLKLPCNLMLTIWIDYHEWNQNSKERMNWIELNWIELNWIELVVVMMLFWNEMFTKWKAYSNEMFIQMKQFIQWFIYIIPFHWPIIIITAIYFVNENFPRLSNHLFSTYKIDDIILSTKNIK